MTKTETRNDKLQAAYDKLQAAYDKLQQAVAEIVSGDEPGHASGRSEVGRCRTRADRSRLSVASSFD